MSTSPARSGAITLEGNWCLSVPRKQPARVRGQGPYRAKLPVDIAGPYPCGSKGWRQREGVWEERQGCGEGGGHTGSEWQEKCRAISIARLDGHSQKGQRHQDVMGAGARGYEKPERRSSCRSQELASNL